jgi:hypothetical protein
MKKILKFIANIPSKLKGHIINTHTPYAQFKTGKQGRRQKRAIKRFINKKAA